MNLDHSLSAYDYQLPDGHIAQAPAMPRDSSRLLVVSDPTHQSHQVFRDLPHWLRPGDLLVLNKTKVLPARLYGYKASGLAIELLLLEPWLDTPVASTGFSNRWLALVKPGRRLKPGARIWLGQTPPISETPSGEAGLWATIMATDPVTSGRVIEFDVPEGDSLQEWLYRLGQMPLPPYITNAQADPDRYQTVYAETPGAVAAPTAGLHFTPELLQTLAEQGIQQAFVTLHVGVGTFRPVEVEEITHHQMHGEWAEVPPETVAAIQHTQANGGRVIAVGTTAVRSLEGASQSGQIQPFAGKVDLFIYPGYEWRTVDGLITNFHLPKSSLMMLVSALIGRQRLLDLYQLAIEQNYRFYSFGDAMLILPEAKQT